MIQVIFPIQPVLEPLISEGHTIFGGIVGPNDGTGCGGGPLTGVGQLIDTQRLVTHFAKLISNGCTNNPHADDNGIILFVHGNTSLSILDFGM